nr:hypothetical protein [Tanacetum cinerariifolium]
KVIHTVEIDIVKIVVEFESSGISSDEFDKETMSSDGLQLKQEDLSYVHALNELRLYEIHVVPSGRLSAPERISLSAKVVIEKVETMSSDGLQLKQEDLSYVHALNELRLYEIHVVPSKHEAHQY